MLPAAAAHAILPLSPAHAAAFAHAAAIIFH
jgi:hypothetical protein